MIVGIAGLGLIGGSLAKAYKRDPNMTVLGFDRDQATMEFAALSEAIDGNLTEERLPDCDMILVALYPQAAVEYLQHIAPFVRRDALVMDCCGTKRLVCKTGFALAEEYGFVFAGGHPMAGTHHSGFRASRASLFDGACMVVVPPRFDDIQLLERIKTALSPAGFGKISVNTAEQHDEIIAFTSQMAHVVSNAYIKSPTARLHKGFSAGSYKDLTRVAWLNPEMWAMLFLENRDNLIREVDFLIEQLAQYRDAMAQGDEEALIRLLDDGRRIKQEVDG